ncbi:MAG: alpha/beta hydrolase [SAR86 cluster bacterium]|nr:alpha/beta hydrolase [SAR86 cluster bacterium]
MKDAQPEWFKEALSVSKEEKSIIVEEKSIYYQHWGDGNKPGMVLVHGSGSHSHWWDFIAPLLLDDFEVSALDLSGMGDSERREDYSAEVFGKEILKVAEDSGFFEGNKEPIICGHSMGGFMSATAGYISDKPLKGVIMVDSPIRPPTYDYSSHVRSGPIRRIKTYPNEESILERFRLTPEQECENQFLVDYIAKWSIKEVENGFQWKFDDTIFDKLGVSHMGRNIAFDLKCNLGIIYGTESLMMTDEILTYIKDNVPSNTPIIPIKNAAHHVPLDQPQELVNSIKLIVREWL